MPIAFIGYSCCEVGAWTNAVVFAAAKQYFFDRFLLDELNEIGLDKGMPG